MKKLVLILPYFGKFKNYFPLFLKSVEANRDYFDLLLFTDSDKKYDYPENVILNKISFEDFKEKIKSKFKLDISLETPYKLCDYKPTYGFVFYDLIRDYKYWGYCDCDLLFGNFKNVLGDLLDEDYDKLFALGHLTLYKNTIENNSIFMEEFNSHYPYIDALTKEEIYVFDEDCRQKDNVHSIFLSKEDKKVFAEDLSANMQTTHNNLYRVTYSSITRKFTSEYPTKKEFFYSNGDIFSLDLNNQTNDMRRTDYLYIHLQGRNMRVKCNTDTSIIQICPDKFISIESLPQRNKDFKKLYPHAYYRKYDVIKCKIKRGIKKIRGNK